MAKIKVTGYNELIDIADSDGLYLKDNLDRLKAGNAPINIPGFTGSAREIRFVLANEVREDTRENQTEKWRAWREELLKPENVEKKIENAMKLFRAFYSAATGRLKKVEGKFTADIPLAIWEEAESTIGTFLAFNDKRIYPDWNMLMSLVPRDSYKVTTIGERIANSLSLSVAQDMFLAGEKSEEEVNDEAVKYVESFHQNRGPDESTRTDTTVEEFEPAPDLSGDTTEIDRNRDMSDAGVD